MQDLSNLQPEKIVAKGTSVLDANGFISKKELQVGQARSLQGFEQSHVFFTPAILYLHGNFHDAPLADLFYATGKDIEFFYKKFSKPIFRGLNAPSNGDVAWNYVLWAVRSEYWKLVSDWLVSITLAYSESNAMAGIGEQMLDIVDPLAESTTVINPSQLRRLTVYAFGLNGSAFCAYFTQDTVTSRPTLRLDVPASAMKVFADAYYNGINPVDARTAYKKASHESHD
jgi:hypothetical protein